MPRSFVSDRSAMAPKARSAPVRSPVACAIWLIGTFFAVAAIYTLLGAYFIGIIQILVYAGAIMVLFLFVIMLVNLHRLPEVKLFGGQTSVALVLAIGLLAFFGYFLLQVPAGQELARPEAFVSVQGQNVGNSQAVAWRLYAQHLLPFEVASVFLLIAMIGAVVLGRRQ